MTAAGPPPPDLSHERAQVLAHIAGSPMARPPAVRAAAPLGPLPPALEAKLAARATPAAPELRRRVVVPSAALAALDLLGAVVAAATGHVALAVVAAVLFVPLASLAALGARYGDNPMGLSPAERRRVASACRWQTRQRWTGPAAHGRERGLVVAAARTAERIAASPAWRSGFLDEQRVRLDLRAELDQVDVQAHRIATARQQAGTDTPATDAAWAAAVDRVAALTAYADQLDGYAERRRAELGGQGDPVADTDLLAGSVRDELALDQLGALTFYLSARRDER